MGMLDGVKVLDFTHAYAGPFCTMTMADFGAQLPDLPPEFSFKRGADTPVTPAPAGKPGAKPTGKQGAAASPALGAPALG